MVMCHFKTIHLLWRKRCVNKTALNRKEENRNVFLFFFNFFNLANVARIQITIEVFIKTKQTGKRVKRMGEL